MEDAAKEDPAQGKEPKFLGKAGWVKKAQGRVLSSYKDRYMCVEKSEVVVYENEDLKNCLERVDLENYDKCHEMKSAFKKKHRLVVIRSSKSGNKVHDLKFQARSAEEKDAWIKALSDGITRAKNKIFDEVTVEESSNLEHVTRTRPKGNRGRRPPTRIHMKEVADVSSDGVLRLDLDLEDAIMPNGTRSAAGDGTDGHKETIKALSPASTAGDAAVEKPLESIKESEEEAAPQKKVLKPPMPPLKDVKPASTIDGEPEKQDVPDKKIVKPPMPPSKEAKLCLNEADKTPQTSPDSQKKIPPTPPSKPISDIDQEANPPPPPSKDKKPSTSVEPVLETIEDGEDDSGKIDEEDDEEKDVSTAIESKNKPHITAPVEPLKRSSSLDLMPEKKAQDCPSSDIPVISLQSEKPPKSEIPVVEVSVKDPKGLSLSPLLGHLPGEEKKKKGEAEEKSVDSGQHSNDESEGSGSEDMLAASTAVLRSSHSGLDTLDTSDNSIEISLSLKQTPRSTKGFTSWISAPTPPLKTKNKMKSASSGDLLSDSPDSKAGSSGIDVIKLETEVALEMENTSELLNRATQQQAHKESNQNTEDLLAQALEKLKRADSVLREVKKLKLAKDPSHRKSW